LNPISGEYEPMTSGLVQNRKWKNRSRRVRSTPMNGHRQTGPTGPFRTMKRHAHRNFATEKWRLELVRNS
jgi:hypothetical protein